MFREDERGKWRRNARDDTIQSTQHDHAAPPFERLERSKKERKKKKKKRVGRKSRGSMPVAVQGSSSGKHGHHSMIVGRNADEERKREEEEGKKKARLGASHGGVVE